MAQTEAHARQTRRCPAVPRRIGDRTSIWIWRSVPIAVRYFLSISTIFDFRPPKRQNHRNQKYRNPSSLPVSRSDTIE
eukprot:scaffold7590_cov181-Pinguiococcus_pyrenoidosus.AAC.1